MTARVLVVDDIPANVKLLEARLTAEYFEVLTAFNGPDALQICERERADVVLLDVMMPGMDGFEVCRRLKANPRTQFVPVIMVTALDMPSDKVQGLESGADDFLTKPVDDIALITRVRNLARLKMLNDEMAMRAATSKQIGMSEAAPLDGPGAGLGASVLIVDDHARSSQRLVEAISRAHMVEAETDPQKALLRLSEVAFDLLIVSLSLEGADGLRLCSHVRSMERTRHLPIIILTEPGDEARLLRGLDMGVNDYVVRPIDRNELLARIRTQVRRKRHSDRLRNTIEESVEAAITDQLTGLFNRRYMENHMKTLVDEALRRGRPLTVLLADVDFFKAVNDKHGHPGGDIVLKEFAARLKRNTRGIDLACRFGGEEFIVIMPDTDLVRGVQVAERLRRCVASDPFQVSPGVMISVTASAGIASLERASDTAEEILRRADQALYCAKRDGRNRVVADAA